MRLNDEELYHYGIPNQKWGVRHGPPYPLDKSVSSEIRYRGAKKLHVRDKDGGHDSANNKSEAALMATRILLDVATLNLYDLPLAAGRLGESFVSKHRNKKYAAEREQSEVDKTTGLKKIKDPDSLSDKENLKRVNPNVGDFNSDSKNNCMLCTATYEMRRRGYDVTAQRDGYGYLKSDITRWFPKAQVKDLPSSERFETPGKYAKKIVAELSKEPEGSRGNIMVGFRFGGNHSMCYEIQNGKPIIRDAQIAKVFKNPERILTHCNSASIARYDNVDFDKKGIKEVCYS